MQNKRLIIFLSLVTPLFLLGLIWLRSNSKVYQVEDYKELIERIAAEQNLGPELIAGIIYVESGGDRAAVSKADAIGLMQLRQVAIVDAAQWLNVEVPDRSQLEDPETNLRFGIAYLQRLLQWFKTDMDLALLAYNLGPVALEERIQEKGGPEKFKIWLAEKSERWTEYLFKVRDWENRFRERWSESL